MNIRNDHVIRCLTGIVLLTLSLMISGFGEKPVETRSVPMPKVEVIADEQIQLPPEVLRADFPAERLIVKSPEYSVSDLKGDDVYAVDQNFFVINGRKQQTVRLAPGVNSIYVISVLGNKRRITKKRVLFDIPLPDVAMGDPDGQAIRSLCLLRIMGPYDDEGGMFLPANGVPTEEFSMVLNQASQDDPSPLPFTRAGRTLYIDIRSAQLALERNIGEPDKPWGEIFSDAAKTPDRVLTRAQLARALMHMKIVQDKASMLQKEFSLK